MVALAQIEQRRFEVRDITTLAFDELLAAFSTFDLDDAARAKAQMAEVLPLIGDEYGLTLGALAADWYDDLRYDAVGSTRSSYGTRVADLPKEGQYRALAGWAAEPLFSSEPDAGTSLTRLSGGLQRLIVGVDRQTIIENANRDPLTVKHARTVAAGACAFCAMLATRGGVYNDESVKFRAHDSCNCMSVPVFPGDELERPSYYDAYEAAYEEAWARVGSSDTKALLAEMRLILGAH